MASLNVEAENMILKLIKFLNLHCTNTDKLPIPQVCVQISQNESSKS